MENRQTRVSRYTTENNNLTQQNAAGATNTNVRQTQTRQNRNVSQPIDLMEILFRLLQSWKSILMACLIGAVIFGAYHTFRVEPSYQATTELYITSTDSLISLSDLQVGTALTEDYQSIIKSRIVLNKVIDQLQLNLDYRGLRKLISVSNPSGTHIIRTTVTSSDMELSRDIANALMNFSIERIYQIVGSNEPTVIEYSEAQAVDNIMPSFLSYVERGGLIGIAIVVIFIFIQVMLDNTLKNDDDIEKALQLPVLAAVPYYKE